MAGSRTRLDRFLSQQLGISRKATRPLLAAGRVWLDGEPVSDRQRVVTPFSRVNVDGRLLQQRERRYLMLNKPAGVVSATRDDRHPTVMDLLDEPAADLHLPGRLDYHTTGLLLLTNDGDWSRRLSDPREGVSKRYRVWLEKPLTQADVQMFADGIHFPYENITTRPAQLQITAECEALVVLCEGRYHQIKRMFGRCGNRVVGLERLAIGGLWLDPQLARGESRALTAQEVQAVFEPSE
ncbi:ribosomal small subunit pseudouridine synthase A [Alcanivorax hongdengensis A-11-3]|uniref:Pseudouridine synthase n=1 Tax=Alcanivorax hongdengensis A-11-3 TaxID=1177179 RepID=L0WAH1_9GAMM|nr:pseudouridine synthase [Alcanivorax hongdengensis]EKF73087.1 ribosomal small subunit pseudouridine synthase A [Alcanivorax hongdengensis A-11-3]